MSEQVEVEVYRLPISRDEFCIEVRALVSTKNIPYLDAIIAVAEEHQVELEDVGNLVDAKVKMELESEFRNMNYLPKIGQLPL